LTPPLTDEPFPQVHRAIALFAIIQARKRSRHEP
jgi:hypothetical protein